VRRVGCRVRSGRVAANRAILPAANRLPPAREQWSAIRNTTLGIALGRDLLSARAGSDSCCLRSGGASPAGDRTTMASVPLHVGWRRLPGPRGFAGVFLTQLPARSGLDSASGARPLRGGGERVAWIHDKARRAIIRS